MSERRQPVLGILGGGQLARMLALAAAPLGVNTLVVDSAADACAGQIAPLVVADWSDYAALEAFAARVDVVTFDFENVPAATAHWLAARVAVFPAPQALAVAQDRLAEKTLFRECGLPTPDFRTVDTREELDQALAAIGAPAILKTRRLGYDGKGQFRLMQLADADAAWTALGAQASGSLSGFAGRGEDSAVRGQIFDASSAHSGSMGRRSGGDMGRTDGFAARPSKARQAARHGLILEAFVPFERELSVIAVRGRDGEFRTWPLTRNWHSDGVLSMSLAPAPDIGQLQQRATALARTLAERLDYVGVFALELFVKDGELLGNEIAPRVHNSGHWSIEGAHTSQFENHVRAVLGLPLGYTGARGLSAMFNWIGDLPDAAPVLPVVDAHWHDYGKQPRPGRKVGHATVCAPDAATLAVRLSGIAAALGCTAQVAPVLQVLDRP